MEVEFPLTIFVFFCLKDDFCNLSPSAKPHSFQETSQHLRRIYPPDALLPLHLWLPCYLYHLQVVCRLVSICDKSTGIAQHVDLHVPFPRDDRAGDPAIRRARIYPSHPPPHRACLCSVDACVETIYALEGTSANRRARVSRAARAG